MKLFSKYMRRISFTITLFGVLLLIYDLGFDQPAFMQNVINSFYIFLVACEILFIPIPYVSSRKIPVFRVWVFDFIFLVYLSVILLDFLKVIDLPFFRSFLSVYFAVIFSSFREFSFLRIKLKNIFYNPALLFVISFITIIFTGAGMLMLPNATTAGISFIDSLFTSTSAVCVTGLSVVDTGSSFTFFGQIIIMILIQIGGLGIMTFAAYFSYFFRGGLSLENQLFQKEVTNTDKLAEVFKMLMRILYFTFLLEIAGAFLIFLTLDPAIMPSFDNRVFFSLFHAVSGFCNAGFSTLQNNLMEPGFAFNYPLHLIVAGLLIMGGLGFPIVFNFLHYIKHLVLNKWFTRKVKHIPWVISMNTRIVLITTTFLIVSGTILFYFFEYNNTLKEHSGIGKVIEAFFCSVTPRTAGFNTIDNSAISGATILLVLFLMWVGASPGGTGGGVKTTTFAVSILNAISLARGKKRIEVYRREISSLSIMRAYSMIFLSFVVIGFAVMILSFTDGDKGLIKLVYETVSAYSTVGLSMGITFDLSDGGKIILTIVMFIGRVSMLTILVALMRRTRFLNYRYPSEEILIN
ncbi:MAG: ATPase [Bacteroidetes bacterium GWF2_38_335]|nr:MAG: ATPase [Bacteroidetes bacterium GWF2_38_335]OFY81438.1 MAG: ATPase [Bacteroidetes bacterium RIFOXYA12_FULL_38_20]HBS85386.1 ATPase [Bacteroidales bacterium]